MEEKDYERCNKVKSFLSGTDSVNLDNLTWVIDTLQQRITDLENKIFLNKE
jgi:uncharacterized protein YaaN involved in tellurite resistance